jgi:hypothetical protein
VFDPLRSLFLHRTPDLTNHDDPVCLRVGIEHLDDIEVRGPSGPVFGPQWIDTSRDIRSGDGKFTITISTGIRGDYTVDFTDLKGFVGSVTFHVTDASPTKP